MTTSWRACSPSRSSGAYQGRPISSDSRFTASSLASAGSTRPLGSAISAAHSAKAFSGRMAGSHRTFTFARFSQPSKAPAPMDVSDAGSVISVRLRQLRNAPSPMVSVV